MKVTFELTNAELDEANCDSADEFKALVLQQLNEGVTDIDGDGSTGEDWLPGFTVEVKLIP